MTDDVLDFSADDLAFIDDVRKGFAEEANSILAGIGMGHMVKQVDAPAPAEKSASNYPNLDVFVAKLERDRKPTGVSIEKLLAGRR
jgi:hypothetical protein